jgi:hypothetical protein
MLLAQPTVAAQSDLLDGKALLESLRQGGFNLYFRHASTDWSQTDDLRERDDWLSCDSTRMRQLSAAGRAASAAIGEAMRELEIPVNEVVASPYCRTMETARLMDLGPVTPSTKVMNLRASRFFGGREAIVASARRLLATSPAAGGNRVIVAHGNVARESTPFYPGEGEGLVFKPDSAGGFRLVGRVSPAGWTELLMRYNP